ncbi:MAG: hypothetical protein IH795_06150, partial [Bacteroidetes bacterium]|nr:hypothetical protein [Bacteroidota bacterium]
MPNYCSIKIIISGSSLNEFKKTLNTENEEGDKVEFGFHQTVPIPDNHSGSSYSDIWGTKSDGHFWCKSVNITDDKVEILTETAWSPPIQWADSCREKFTDLDIKIAWCEAMCQ